MDSGGRWEGGLQVLLPGQAPAANIILALEYGGGWRDIQVRGQLPVSCPFVVVLPRPFVVGFPALLWWISGGGGGSRCCCQAKPQQQTSYWRLSMGGGGIQVREQQ